MLAWLAALATAIVAGIAPARADDVSAATRGVVRVVISASIDGQEIGRGHGSGFAIAPNRIVTNAHVVELAHKFPSLVTIDIVPEEGSDYYRGELVAYDEDRDLAIIQFDGPPLPPLTVYSKPLPDGYPLVSLGYPSNIDQATATSLSQLLVPTPPARSTGILSAHRSQRGLETIEHTAQIARGNSGGPLLDNCGRVVGVNRAVTTAQEGDGSFVIALGEDELEKFLEANKQAYNQVEWPCTSMAAALERDREREAQQTDMAEQEARDRQDQAQRAHDDAVRKAEAANERTRDNFLGGAALMLVFGALAIGGGGLLLSKNQRRYAIWAVSGGGVLIVGSIVLFLLRPEFDPSQVSVPTPGEAGTTQPIAQQGKMVCKLQPDRSRITVSSGEEVRFDWNGAGCLSGRTQYVDTGNSWQRILVPEKDQTVSFMTYDPTTRTFINDRYFLGSGAMQRLREMRPDASLKTCTDDQAKLAELASRQSSVKALLPAQPDERLVYSCSPQ